MLGARNAWSRTRRWRVRTPGVARVWSRLGRWSRTRTMPAAWPSIPSAARRSSIGRERRPFQAASGPRCSEGQL